MANSNDPNNPKGSRTQVRTPRAGAVLGAATDAALVPAGAGTALGGLGARAGAIALDVGTDVTDQLDASVPSFGNVLQSIGNGVASSQAALDQGVIDTVNKLNATKIKVVTDVVEVLNDDGLPDVTKTELVTEDVSVLNFFTPTIHEWKNVQIAMDLAIGSFDSQQGVQFSQHQHSESVTATGLFWGFVGWFDTDTVDTNNDVTTSRSNDLAWQSGQLRVDALLGPRKTGKFPIPAEVTIGPQIFVTQGVVQEQKNGNTVTARSVDLEIEVRKSSGDANPQQNITVNSGGLLPSFPNGSATDPNGKVSLTLTRTLVPGFTAPVSFGLSASLGQVRKPFNVTL